jgi:hypothetical protein
VFQADDALAGTHAGEQFPAVKWFDDVVVGAAIQCLNDIVLVGAA